MNVENSECSPSAEQELAFAQQRVAEAKRKIDLLEQARLEKLRQQIADAAAAEEQRRFREAEEKRLIEERWIERRRAEAEAAERERRDIDAARREREQSLARAEEEQQQRQKHEKEIERLASEALCLEQEARRREAELSSTTPAVQAVEPMEATNGRELLFGRLARPARRFDGHDGHAEEAPMAPASPVPDEEKQ